MLVKEILLFYPDCNLLPHYYYLFVLDLLNFQPFVDSTSHFSSSC